VSRSPATPTAVAAVAVGGAVGGLLRWSLGEAVPDGAGFPWTTFWINVSGALVLALVPAVDAVRRWPLVAVCVGPGLLGGYTTLSAYAEDARVLLADGRMPLALAYVGGTLAACLVAVALAHRLTTGLERQEFEAEEGNE
jgi:CrcB protein